MISDLKEFVIYLDGRAYVCVTVGGCDSHRTVFLLVTYYSV